MNLDIDTLRATRAEIDLDNFEHNLKEIRKATPISADIMPVIKADGYGHGALELAKAALNLGINYFAVATLEEAKALRLGGIDSDILILGPLFVNQYKPAIEDGITFILGESGSLPAVSAAAAEAGRKAKVHVKIDTGMSRVGLNYLNAADELKSYVDLPSVDFEGIMTHFATSDEKDKGYTYTQYERFIKVIDDLTYMGFNFRIRHCSNSGAILDLPEMAMDMVRPGIIIYGLYPSSEVTKNIELRPVMKIITRITHLKLVDAGTPVSYGCTYTTRDTELVATIPIGYADGYSRILSGSAEVIVNGVKCRVVGRICMDQCMVSMPPSMAGSVKIGDEVVIVGEQLGSAVSLDDLAEKMGTINYEVACMISKRVPRVYCRNGRVESIRMLGWD